MSSNFFNKASRRRDDTAARTRSQLVAIGRLPHLPRQEDAFDRAAAWELFGSTQCNPSSTAALLNAVLPERAFVAEAGLAIKRTDGSGSNALRPGLIGLAQSRTDVHVNLSKRTCQDEHVNLTISTHGN